MTRLIASLALAIACLAIPAYAQPDDACNMGRGNPDPRDQKVVCLPEIGRMEGELTCVRGGEQYGRNIYAVGDVNHDGLQDWIVGHIRCDSLIYPGNGTVYTPEEILLYKGVRGGLPSVESGERIGPSEYGAVTNFLASGDWDNDGNIDIACRVQLFGDTAFGNKEGYYISSLIVFWGNADGGYSVQDTSRLSCGADSWLGICTSISGDLDHDGISDLVIHACGGKGFDAGEIIRDIARIQVFKGHAHQRWGRDGIGREADWRWWLKVPCTHLSLLDQDSDGNTDVALYDNSTTGALGHLALLYGNATGLPDTAEIQIAEFTAAGGHASLFSDVTGDGVPELLVHTGRNPASNSVKVYVGLKGQRLAEQFGSGSDAPPTDSARWWGKPWSEVWLPFRFDERWSLADPVLLNYGDGDLDGVNDIWAYSWPYLLCYRAGERLDSLADGLLDTRPAIQSGANAVLGDIDGSGRCVLGFGDGNAVVLFTGSDRMPRGGTPRRLPDGTGRPASGVMVSGPDTSAMLTLTALPNPSRGELRLRWDGKEMAGSPLIILHDASGGEVRRLVAGARSHEATMAMEGIAPGTYFITITMDNHTATTMVVLR